MATLTVSDVEQSRILMLASYSNSSNDLRTSLSGSAWEPVPVAGEALFTDNPLLVAPVTAFAARQGETLAIVFQGTNENVDWVNNVVGGLFSWAPLYLAYSDFFDGLFDYIGSLEAADISKILVTGHSQGAAMVEFFMDQVGALDDRYVAVAYASPGIEGQIDDLGPGRILRIEHTDDIVVDLAERGGLDGLPVAPELDLRVELGENSIVPGGSEHGSGVYAATARVLFTSPFAEEILRDFDNLTFAIQSSTNDDMFGDAVSNVLFGQGGQDNIFGGGGRDLISGGAGSDDLRGEDGDDEIYGGASFDFLYGGDGDDSLYGGEGFDYIYGQAGSDTLNGGVGNDYLYGGDEVREELTSDQIFGGDGDDHLFGQKGDDLIDGGDGEDTAYFGFLGDAYSFSIIRQQGPGDVGIRVEQQHLGNASPFPDTNGSATIFRVETLNIDGVGVFSTSDLSSRERVISVDGNFSEADAKETGGYDRYWINAGQLFTFSAGQSLYEVVPSLNAGPSSFAVRRTDTGEVFEFISDLNFVSFAGGQVESVDAAFMPVVDPEPTDDHGDTRGTATLVTDLDGTAVRGEIEVSGDEDFFRFNTQSGRTYGVVATPDNSGVDPEIRVYNSSGQLVASNADLGGGPSAGLSFTSSGGTYYVEISGEGGSTGDYGIGVSLLGDGSGGTAPGDASEPDADLDVSTGRRPTHEGDNGEDSWVFSSSSSTEVFIVGNGGDDIVRTGRRDDIVFGGDGNDEIQTRDGDDIIDGGDDEDDIEGGDGNDGILGGRHDDTIDGGDGDDVIAGQHGDDRIDGGVDDDAISGGDGDDRIDGESGNDGILGDDGDDNLRGGTGNDTIYGGDDDDFIDGEQGRDFLYGDRGRDFIRGGEDADRIDGGDHDDEMLGEEGNDSISGGSGDDIIRPGAGDDIVDGDGGSDTLSYESMNGGATIDMTTETAYGAEIGFDRFDSIDHINGTNGNDIIIGDGDDNQLNGDSGRDIITGGAGNDEIDGGSSADTAIFSGNRADYTITASTNPEFDLQVVDNRPGSPDGTDLIDSVAFLQFADVRIRDDDALSSAPTANDDAFEVSSDGPAILDVLANDTDPDGNTLSVSAVVSQPASGLVYVVDNRIVFDPSGEFIGTNEQTVSLTYRISDGVGFSNVGSVSVVVKPPSVSPAEGPLINGAAVSDPVGYGGGQDKGNVEVSADGSTVSLTDNAWKSIALDQTITADTVLSFEFNADALGEIHGIGFDTDGSISADRTFQLAGTQSWGIQGENRRYDTGDGWQSYDIRVGDYFIGDFDRIVFAMDDDNGTGADSAFRNIGIAEIAPPPTPSPLINGSTVADPVGYGGSQDKGDVEVSDDGTTITLTDNAWKSIALDQTITADTVLSFEFNAGVLGEIHGIGFDTDGSISADRTFQLAGTQTWGIQGENGVYDIGDGWQRYDIRVGDYFTGDFDRIVFAMDDDNGTGADSAFRNIEIAEIAPPPPEPYVIESFEVMLSFDGTGFDATRTQDPTIAMQDGVIHLFYSGLPFSNYISVGLATSEDNESFVRTSDTPVISNFGSTPFTENRIFAESVLYDAETEQWLMYFWGNQRNLSTDAGHERGIGVATSSDLKNWDLQQTPLFLEAGPRQGRDLIEVVQVDGEYIMYLQDNNPDALSIPLIAMSTDGFNFGAEEAVPWLFEERLLTATEYNDGVIALFATDDPTVFAAGFSEDGETFVFNQDIVGKGMRPGDLVVKDDMVEIWSDVSRGNVNWNYGNIEIERSEVPLIAFIGEDDFLF